MHDLDALCAQVGEAGLPVQLTVEGAVRPLPSSLDLTAYRIVQESLTNTLKHAGRTRAQVTVRYEAHSLAIEVLDEGRGVPAGSGARRRTRTAGHARACAHFRRRAAGRAARARRLRRARAPASGRGGDMKSDAPGGGASRRITVVLVDDEQMIRMGLRLILESEDDIEVVGEAGDGREGRGAHAPAGPGRGAHGRADAGHERHRGHARDRRAGARRQLARRSSSPPSTWTSTCSRACAPAPAVSC